MQKISEQWKLQSKCTSSRGISAFLTAKRLWINSTQWEYYGYEIHAKIDAKSKLIKKSVATDASVHDSQPTKQLVDESDTGQEFHADSAYIGKGVKRVLRKYNMKDRIIKRNVRGKKISKLSSRVLSTTC